MKQKKPPYCHKCGETDADKFASYVPSRCQPCRRAMSRSYYEQHKEERRAVDRVRNKIYRLRRTKYQLAQRACHQRRWYKQNKGKRRDYARLYAKVHKEEIALRTQLWRYTNKDRLTIRDRNHYKAHRAEMLANVAAKTLFGTFGIRSLTVKQIQVMGIIRLVKLHLREIVDDSTATKIRKGLSDDPQNAIYELFSFSFRRNDDTRKREQGTVVEKGNRHTQRGCREESVGGNQSIL